MNVSTIDQKALLQQPQGPPTPERLRQAAMQFEAILLMQLTSALNNSNSDDDDTLFGSDAGAGMAKQLFSEQMATTMSQSGGCGIADLIIKQLGGGERPTGGIKGLAEIVSSVKALGKGPDVAPLSKVEAQLRRAAPLGEPPLTLGDPNDVQIISRYEDETEAKFSGAPARNLIPIGQTSDSTSSSVAPGSQITTSLERLSDGVLPADSKLVFASPARGRISSKFGNRHHPIDGITKFHGGVDIAVPTGTAVGAAAEGIVSFAGRKGGYGNLVIIDHPDGRQTRYAHLSSFSVSEGETVSIGQQIARSGSTGKSTGPHLHFEIRENGIVVDPMRILSNVLPANAER